MSIEVDVVLGTRMIGLVISTFRCSCRSSWRICDGGGGGGDGGSERWRGGCDYLIHLLSYTQYAHQNTPNMSSCCQNAYNMLYTYNYKLSWLQWWSSAICTHRSQPSTLTLLFTSALNPLCNRNPGPFSKTVPTLLSKSAPTSLSMILPIQFSISALRRLTSLEFHSVLLISTE